MLIGTDKIGHFLAQGWEYFEFAEDLKAEEKEDLICGFQSGNASVQDQEIIRKGEAKEHTLLGLESGGVFSYADLSANVSGLIFYLSFFKGDHPYFVRDSAREQVSSHSPAHFISLIG